MRTTTPKPRHVESSIQRSIWQLYQLQYSRHFIMHAVPNGVQVGGAARVGAILKAMGTVAGAPDFAGVLPGGRTFYVEVKTPDGKLSPAQKEFKARAEEFGADWQLVRGVGDFQEWAERQRTG